MSGLSLPLRAAIRFETNYTHHFDSLLRINAKRFRGLGDEHCRAFVAHAARTGDELRLNRLDSVAYLMFLMNWLGSHFLHDPRYTAVSAVLQSDTSEEERVSIARDGFLTIAAQHIGERGEIVVNRVAKLPTFEALVTDTTQSHHKLHDALLDTWDIHGEARAAYPRGELEDDVIQSARALGIDSPLGRRICLVLTFILGARFHADPLYPWVRDKTDAARKDGASPEDALLDYAKKRMGALLRNAEASDV